MAKFSARLFFGVCLAALLLLVVLWCLPCAMTVKEGFQDSSQDSSQDSVQSADLSGVNITSASAVDFTDDNTSSNNSASVNLPSDPAGMQQFMTQALLQGQANGIPQSQTVAEVSLAFTQQGIPPDVVNSAMQQALAAIGGSTAKPTLQQCQKYYSCQCLSDLVLVPPGMSINVPASSTVPAPTS